jgi:hypothetical protein
MSFSTEVEATNVGVKFQETLESGTTLKTINGNSLLGSGGLSITELSEINLSSLIKAQTSITSNYGNCIFPVVNGIYNEVDYVLATNLKSYVLDGLGISDVSGLQTALNNKLDASSYNEHYKGSYTTLVALETAHPTASAGDYALVDAGNGQDAIFYIWDNTDTAWIPSASAVLNTTDTLTEGSTNLYFTENRVRATALTGFSSSSGTITATDTILQAFNKLDGNVELNKFTDIKAIKAISYEWTGTSEGTTSFLITSITLPAGTYLPSANIGCAHISHSATIELRKESDNVLVKSLGGSAGYLSWKTASSSFTLATQTTINIYLSTDNTQGVGILNGFKFT